MTLRIPESAARLAGQGECDRCGETTRVLLCIGGGLPPIEKTRKYLCVQCAHDHVMRDDVSK